MAKLGKSLAILLIVVVFGGWGISYAAVSLFDSTLRIEQVVIESPVPANNHYQHAYEVSQYPINSLTALAQDELPESLTARLRLGYGKNASGESIVTLSFTESSVWQLWQNLLYRTEVIEATQALSRYHHDQRDQALVGRALADQISEAVIQGNQELLTLRLTGIGRPDLAPQLAQITSQFGQFNMAEAGKAVLHLPSNNIARFRFDYVSPSLQRAWLLVDVQLDEQPMLAAISAEVVRDGQ